MAFDVFCIEVDTYWQFCLCQVKIRLLIYLRYFWPSVLHHSLLSEILLVQCTRHVVTSDEFIRKAAGRANFMRNKPEQS